MKKLSYLLVFILLLTSCSAVKKTSTKNISEIKNKINATISNWHLAATDADFEDYFGKMDSVSVFIGTDASENWSKQQFKAFSKPYFDKGKAWDFKTLARNVYVNNTGDFAWFDELLTTWMGTCRGSGVLEKNEDAWAIKHYVLSVAIPNDDVKAVFAAKKKNDSIFLKKFN